MPLVPMRKLLSHAEEHGYAVGYFESWNFESVLAVMDAAEETHSPIIIGFNGSFIAADGRERTENIFHYGALGRAIAEHASVPTAVILNESDKVPLLLDGLKAGFNIIMYDGEDVSYREAVTINKKLSEAAHAAGGEVEAEAGKLAEAVTGSNNLIQGENTDPDMAAAFVGETGIDALSVAVGNVHMLEGGRKAKLNLELVRTLRDKVPVPLVLHGGTGLDENDVQEAIRLGISKINVGTVLRRTYANGYKEYFQSHDIDTLDPNEITSTGGPLDMHRYVRSQVAAEVVRLIKMFGSDNKAWS